MHMLEQLFYWRPRAFESMLARSPGGSWQFSVMRTPVALGPFDRTRGTRRRSVLMHPSIEDVAGKRIGCGSTGGHKTEVNMSEKINRASLFFKAKAIAIAFAAIVVGVPGIAVAQDKYALKVPGRL